MSVDSKNTRPVDDAELGSLVREVASGWELPRVRLDQPGWRDRVRTPRSRRADSLSGWLGRAGQAATAAIALTVVAALVAVYLTRPPQSTGKAPASGSPAPSGSTPRPSGVPSATPLPKLFVAGPPPAPSRILVETQAAMFELLDLSTGTTGSPLAVSTFGSQIRTLSNGETVCLCIRSITTEQGMDTRVRVSLVRYDSSFASGQTTTVLDLQGAPDPRDVQTPATAGNLSAFVTFSPDRAYGYVGWSARVHPAWTSGIVVIQLSTGAVVQRLDLPSVSDGSGTGRTYIDAPRVIGRAGDRAVIDRGGYHYSPTSSDSVFDQFADEFTAAAAAGGSLAAPAKLPDQGCDVAGFAGGLPDGGLWLSCTRYDQQFDQSTTIRRLDSDGALAGATSVDVAAIDGNTSVVSPDGANLYLWNPLSLTLTQVDLATGVKRSAHALAATSSLPDGGPLTALGQWLAPTAMAKTFLSPGIAVSPDGGRVYAIGVRGDASSGSDVSGSSGVSVFDTASMQPLATWPATADYISIALNADGSSVFLTGMPGARADGIQDRRQPASVTVIDAATGSVQLIAGDLGDNVLTFAEPVLTSR
jgi:hypothetical protein